VPNEPFAAGDHKVQKPPCCKHSTNGTLSMEQNSDKTKLNTNSMTGAKQGVIDQR